MKRSLTILLVSIAFLNIVGLVSAQTTLPNPLYPVSSFGELMANIANYIAVYIVGGLSVIMFIWAGILYLTSGANPGNVQRANKVVLYAVIGLAIALSGAGLIQLIYSIIQG